MVDTRNGFADFWVAWLVLRDTDVLERHTPGTVVSLPVGSLAPTFVGMDAHIVTNEDLMSTVGWMRITNEVPEPAGLGLMVTTAMAMGARRRR